MTWSSRIPVAMDALHTVISAALGAADDMKTVKVLDGPVVDGGSYKEALTIGHTSDGETPVVESEIMQEGLARSPDRERFTIWSTIEVLAGSGSVSSHRQRAYAILAAAGQAIAADRKLGRTV